MRSYTYHLRSLLRPLAFALSLALLPSVPTLLGMEGRSMMIASRNGMVVRKPLPYDAEVEYVYIGDGGFFTTPIKHSSSVSLSAQFMAMSQLTGVVGNYSAGVGVNILGTVAARYGSASVSSSVGFGNFKTDVTIENGIFNVNGTDYSFTQNYFSLDRFITIGQPPDNTVIEVRTTIYSVQISNGSVTVNAIPVRIGQEGYFYDTVSKSLLERSSVGTFTPGPDKS